MSRPTRREALAAAAFLLPGRAAAAPAETVLRVPITVVRDQPLVALQLNGRGPFTFLIDTGAGGFGITAEAAARAGLPSASRAVISGVSGRAVAVRTWYARDVKAAGVVDLGLASFAEFPGGGLDGYLPGNAFLAKPAALAFADQEIRLSLTGRPDTAGYTRVPTRFDVRPGMAAISRAALDPHIIVDATLGGRAVRLALDTGAQAPVALLPAASGMYWDRTPALDIGIAGATGRASGRLVRVGPLKLGDVETASTIVSLTDPQAPHTDSTVDGLLGMDMLRQLEVILDAGRSELWMRRSAAFGQPFRYNRSGLATRSVAAGLEVVRVASASPGAAAGLAAGDVLTPDQPMSRETFSWSLEQGPGVVVDMDATRAGRARPVRLVLKDVI